MMVPKENGGERGDSLNHLGKEAESDYEPARHSVSSQGETQMTHDSKAKKASRVSQKLSRKQAVENLSRPTRSTSERQESTKLHFKASNNNRKKSEKPNKGVTPTKNHSYLKVDNAKCSTMASSESSEGSEEKVIEDRPIDGVIEEKHFEEVKEIDILDEAPNCDQSVGTDNEMFDTEDNSFDEEKVSLYQKVEEMELRIEKLEEELREVAALEISLYSIVPEHGSSAHKVYIPARRLSRLYIHACKHWTRDKRATVAKNTVSGLVLIAKSCGSDVSRLTFWLSNTVILREIISGAFGNISDSSFINRVGASNGIANKNDYKSTSIPWKSNGGTSISKKDGLLQFVNDWQETNTYIAALEKIESWIFSRVVESVWWQALTPRMQSPVDGLYKRKYQGKLNGHALGDQHQEIFSIELWKNAFVDAFSRLCPLRSGGHECGCLPVLARMVMEQCVSRLDVAMFNAILRESANEIPTDPVSDPIVDPKVLPIPAGDLSFGSGAQLKNSIGNWSRWLTDLFGMDADDSMEDGQGDKDDYDRQGAEFKCFRLLNSLSDLLMLPKDMLLDSSIRKEICPSIGLPLITRILCNFTPDEFCPDAVPGIVLEELNTESMFDRHCLSVKEPFTSFPYAASPVVYCSPSAADLALKVADAGGSSELGRNKLMVQRKGYTSDEELDDLESPLTSIIDKTPPVSPANGNGNGHVKTSAPANARFELLREEWNYYTQSNQGGYLIPVR